MEGKSCWRPVAESAGGSRNAVAIYHFDPAVAAAENGGGGGGNGDAVNGDGDPGASSVGRGEWRLQLLVGDVITLLQECSDGWYFGHPANNPGLLGIFPKSYVAMLPSRSGLPPIAEEISAVLREWNFQLRDMFLGGNVEMISMMPTIMREVMTRRTELIGGNLTVEESKEVQRKVTTKMDFLNHRLGMDLVVRDSAGNQLSPETTSGVAYFRQHLQVGNSYISS